MNWIAFGMYVVALMVTGFVDAWRRDKLRSKLAAENQKELEAARLDYQGQVDAFKATSEKNLENSFADGAKMGCKATMDALKQIGAIDQGGLDVDIEIARITRTAIQQAKTEQTNQDDAFLRALKIKP